MPTYDGTCMKDLDATTPAENESTVPELNDAIREIKTVLLNQNVILTTSSNYTLTASDSTVFTERGVNLTLPDPSTVSTTTRPKCYYIRNDSSETTTIVGAVDGVTNPTIVAGAGMIIIAKGANWKELKVKNAYYATTAGAATNATYATSAVTADKTTFIGAMVYKSSAQTLLDNTTTTLSFSTEAYDTNAFFNSGTSDTKLVVPAGITKVRVSAQISFASSADTGRRVLAILKNGTSDYAGKPRAELQNSSGTVCSINIASPWLSVSEGDYFEAKALQQSGGVLDTSSNHNEIWFAIEAIKS